MLTFQIAMKKDIKKKRKRKTREFSEKRWEVLLRRLKTKEKWPLSERTVLHSVRGKLIKVWWSYPEKIPPLACKLNSSPETFLIKEQITVQLPSTVCKHLDIKLRRAAILTFLRHLCYLFSFPQCTLCRIC